MRLDPMRVDRSAPFASFGLDSAAAVGLVGELSEFLGRRLSATLVWDYPNISALAAHLVGAEPTPPSLGAGRVSELMAVDVEKYSGPDELSTRRSFPFGTLV